MNESPKHGEHKTEIELYLTKTDGIWHADSAYFITDVINPNKNLSYILDVIEAAAQLSSKPIKVIIQFYLAKEENENEHS